MATLFTLDVHYTIPQPNRKPPRKRFSISCKSNESPTKPPESPNSNTPSLSEQLKPLSTDTLPPKQEQNQARLMSKPKSTWVNPAKAKRSVLSLQRQKRAPSAHAPQDKEIQELIKKLNYCGEGEFLAVLEQNPNELTRENALLLLNVMKSWQKTLSFFNWMKTQNLFPMETMFYNITMKSLRFGKQFDLIEELANEMVSNEIPLDNITYSTIISCAKRCNLFDKAVEWFERMYKTGLMPDEVTYSAILDVYAKLGKVEEVLSLYERGVASGWKPDAVAFSVMGRMFGVTGDYDGIRYVLKEMENLGVKPNVVVYNTLLEAMGKAGKPGLARSLFQEMLDSGLSPNEKTLTALAKIYGKARWAKDALGLWEEIKSRNWPVDLYLYNTLLNMCADIGLVEEAEKLFGEMKVSYRCRPDSWSYTAMLNIYGSGHDVDKGDKAMKLFEQMSRAGVPLNVMGLTCLIQCFGKEKRINDLVRVFGVAVNQGVKPDDRLCGCLLSVVALCDTVEDMEKVLSCLKQANPRLVSFVRLIEDPKTSLDVVKEEFKGVISDTSDEARRPFCNCFIDICRNKKLHERAHDLLYLGTVFKLYPGLHNKTKDEWNMDVRSLSIGAAQTALEEWMGSLAKIVRQEEALPLVFSAQTGSGTHRFSQGLASAFASHLERLSIPFKPSEEKAGCFVATREDLVSWLQSNILAPTVAA